MRIRAVGVAVMAAVAATVLAGCHSNVGVAARYDGQRLSESQLASYVTPQAKGVQLSQGVLTPPKAFALYIVISNRLFADLLRQTPGGMPAPGQLSSIVSSVVKNDTPQHAVASRGVTGYSPSFAQLVLRYFALRTVIGQRAQQGVKIGEAIKSLHFPVSINPRYGAWDAKNLTVNSASTVGVPGFVSLQPSAGFGAPSG